MAEDLQPDEKIVERIRKKRGKLSPVETSFLVGLHGVFTNSDGVADLEMATDMTGISVSRYIGVWGDANLDFGYGALDYDEVRKDILRVHSDYGGNVEKISEQLALNRDFVLGVLENENLPFVREGFTKKGSPVYDRSKKYRGPLE